MILAVLLVLAGIRFLIRKEKPLHPVVFAVLAAVTVLSLAVIALCPGNAGRNAVSLSDLPIYETFGFGDKLYLGLLSIERVFLANADLLFCVTSLVWTSLVCLKTGDFYETFGFGDKLYLGLLSIERVFLANADLLFCVTSLVWTSLVCLKTGDFKKTLLSSGPLFVLFGQTAARTAYPGLSGLFVVPEQILEWSWGELSTWIPMVYLAVSAASMIYALYQLFGEDLYEYVCVLILLGCGFGAGMVLGFMATIYVSGERVYAPLYAILLFVTHEYVCVLILLGCGFGAGMVLGFMATIYVSGERVYAPLYAILLFVTLLGVYRQKGVVQEKLKTAAGKLLATFVAVSCCINVLFITLSV